LGQPNIRRNDPNYIVYEGKERSLGLENLDEKRKTSLQRGKSLKTPKKHVVKIFIVPKTGTGYVCKREVELWGGRLGPCFNREEQP